MSDWVAMKLSGTGPDERYVLYAHQLAGETEMTYCVMGSCTNKELAFKSKQRNPKEELGPKETLSRKSGEIQARISCRRVSSATQQRNRFRRRSRAVPKLGSSAHRTQR